MPKNKSDSKQDDWYLHTLNLHIWWPASKSKFLLNKRLLALVANTILQRIGAIMHQTLFSKAVMMCEGW
jgi:hypothetical protein